MPNVLLVEDDQDIREHLAGILARHGYSVVTAMNGVEALQCMRGTVPSLVLLDLMLPTMDGWQLRLEMLKDPALAQIPVVVLSGAGSVDREAAALGAVGYVVKPFRSRAVLALLAQHCAPSRGT